MYLLNAFSLNMLGNAKQATIKVAKISPERARELLAEGFVSAVGHLDTANVIANILGLEVPVNRVSIQLNPGDRAIVAQYRGPRLPEGATTLPPGAAIDFYLVSVEQ